MRGHETPENHPLTILNGFSTVSEVILGGGFWWNWGTQCPSKGDLNADFFVSIVRNQELGCLLRGGVAGLAVEAGCRDEGHLENTGRNGRG